MFLFSFFMSVTTVQRILIIWRFGPQVQFAFAAVRTAGENIGQMGLVRRFSHLNNTRYYRRYAGVTAD